VRRDRSAHRGTLAALGLVYGAIGVVRLGVVLDLPLIAGAAALGLLVVHPRAVTSFSGQRWWRAGAR